VQRYVVCSVLLEQVNFNGEVHCGMMEIEVKNKDRAKIGSAVKFKDPDELPHFRKLLTGTVMHIDAPTKCLQIKLEAPDKKGRTERMIKASSVHLHQAESPRKPQADKGPQASSADSNSSDSNSASPMTSPTLAHGPSSANSNVPNKRAMSASSIQAIKEMGNIAKELDHFETRTSEIVVTDPAATSTIAQLFGATQKLLETRIDAVDASGLHSGRQDVRNGRREMVNRANELMDRLVVLRRQADPTQP